MKATSSLFGHPATARKSLSRSLLVAVSRHGKASTISVGTILSCLGERSFGWSIMLFSLINLIPMPIGSNMVTAIPLLLLTAQIALGFSHVRLPAAINRVQVSRKGFQRAVLRLRPLFRPIESTMRPRHLWLFQPRSERLIGALLFAVSVALFLPIPLSGFISAMALFITSLGLTERDGRITFVGLAIGLLAVGITLLALVTLIVGASTLMEPD